MENNEIKDELLLAQWQTCVEMANSISQRRDTMNNIFVTLNLAIMAAVSIVWNIKSILILVAGIVVCVLWILFIRNYKQLNAVKFEIINKIEKGLPYQAFNEEWEKLKSSKKYMDSTKLEKFLPIMFIILYFVTAIIILIIKLKTGGTT
ncbi:hypothetical protein [Treponema sp. Marseille-Q4523]|uniref:RipA family octameric membrane protein n=1 Tax=Treponema sp. Marseille-Q4523 TaxID=2810610 RepID=UPI001960A027|nr:hypothetical protein [Treponema sp. Marseille-Q4523]MBM7021924.1 hypothetical protein [Treponema sp. Marseille-Q4523]